MLPERLRPDLLRRMATLDSMSPEVLREIGQVKLLTPDEEIGREG